jgi:hypothetical protein
VPATEAPAAPNLGWQIAPLNREQGYRCQYPFVWETVAFGVETSLVSRLQPRSFSRLAVGISRKLIAVNSLIEKPCLEDLGCHPFRDLSGSRGFPSIIGCRLGRYPSAPSPKKRLIPFHFCLPCGSAVVSGSGRSR